MLAIWTLVSRLFYHFPTGQSIKNNQPLQNEFDVRHLQGHLLQYVNTVVGLSMGGWGAKSRHLIGFQSALVLKASDTLQTMSHRHSKTSPQSLQIRADAGIFRQCNALIPRRKKIWRSNERYQRLQGVYFKTWSGSNRPGWRAIEGKSRGQGRPTLRKGRIYFWECEKHISNWQQIY